MEMKYVGLASVTVFERKRSFPWTEEPGRLQSMGSQRVRRDLVTKQQQQWGEFGGFSGQGIYRSADRCKQVD